MSHNNLSGAPAPARPLLTHTSHLFLPTQFFPPVAPFLPHLHSQVACQLSQVAPRQPFIAVHQSQMFLQPDRDAPPSPPTTGQLGSWAQ